jgi:hypothetical protein
MAASSWWPFSFSFCGQTLSARNVEFQVVKPREIHFSAQTYCIFVVEKQRGPVPHIRFGDVFGKFRFSLLVSSMVF